MIQRCADAGDAGRGMSNGVSLFFGVDLSGRDNASASAKGTKSARASKQCAAGRCATQIAYSSMSGSVCMCVCVRTSEWSDGGVFAPCV